MEKRDAHIQPYAWVVLAAGFLSCAFAFGGAKAFGVFYVEFLEKYGEGSGSTAWIASVSMGLLLGFGIPSSWLCEMFSARVVMVMGGVIAALGHVISSFVTRMEWLYFTYGVITGIGRGMCFTPSLLMVNTYFVHRRAFANGIFAAGSGVGSFALPFVTRVLLDNYGLDGALLVFTGITLNLCVCGALMRPFCARVTKAENVCPGTRTERSMSELISSNDFQHAFSGNMKEMYELKYPDIQDEVASRTSTPRKSCGLTASTFLPENGLIEGKDAPTSAVIERKCLQVIPVDVRLECLNAHLGDSWKDSSLEEETERLSNNPVLNETTTNENLEDQLSEPHCEFSVGSVKKSSSEPDVVTSKKSAKRYSLPEQMFVTGEIPMVNLQLNPCHWTETMQCDDIEISMKNILETDLQLTAGKKGTLKGDEKRLRTDLTTLVHSPITQNEEYVSANASIQKKEDIALYPANFNFSTAVDIRPEMQPNSAMGKKEEAIVQVNGNLTLYINPRQNNKTVVAENTDVSGEKAKINDIESNADLSTEDSPFLKINLNSVKSSNSRKTGSRSCPRSLCKSFKTPHVDVSILGYPVFLIYELAFVLVTAGYLTNFIMLPAHAVHIGFTKPQADVLLSIIGMADIVGRTFFGWFSDLKLFSRRNLSAFLAFLGSVSMILLPLSDNYIVLCAYAVSVGLFPGACSVIAFVLLTEIIGDRLNLNVIGIHSTIFAIPAILSPPLAGGLRDWTGNWDLSFRVIGVCLLISMVVTLWIGPLVVRKVNKKEQKR